ncbi:hypothetical protein CHU93_02180 [Sandarakinorhabdus cyanobacteriorum]|uniref:Uncharacterized protein n=1 Tax=Sandarakinorhabdus cyanobacteriorum TaxID=1981098 RepID=A0A255YZP3_9SPHN|nr:hypothetical protein [Sandarakinorhabdus cyanobacteriorum]OYQ34723.1 hypothetical protein CHU93_02180 [Sandarakinorhabdus cyanobacteriorum]
MNHVIDRALAGDASAVLHRVQAEEGFAALVGRDAVLGRLRELAGPMTEQAVTAGNDAFLALPDAHLWARLEAGRIAALTIIAVRDAGLAAELAAAHPCHRPLGELVSGRGQLAPVPGEGALAAVMAAFAARNVPALAPLHNAPPDAVLLPRTVLALPDGGTAALCQLLGHADGRRISLPVSLLMDSGGGLLAMCHDPLALAAASLRPFWPE